MKKRTYIAPVAGYGMMLGGGLMVPSVTNTAGDAGIGLGSGDPGSGGGQSAASRQGSFWDDTE